MRKRYLRRSSQALVLSQNMAVCRILGRFKLFADPQDLSISPHILLDGIWEPEVTEVVVDVCRRGAVAIDVGANLGYFTTIMASLVGDSGRVIAFEPNPAMADRIDASLALNGLASRVTLHRRPVASVSNRASVLAIPPNHPGGAQITGARMEGWITVDTVTTRLDDVAGALDAEFVKIDAEGMEEEIWRGMTAMIAGVRLRTIVLEFAPESFVDAPSMVSGIVAAGFRIDWIRGRGLVPLSPADLLDDRYPLRMLLLRR